MCRDSISLRCHKRQNYKLQSCRPRSILQRCSVRWSQCCSCRSSAMFYTLFTILFDKVPRNYAIFIFVSFCTDGPRTRGNKKFSIQLFMFRVHRPAVKLYTLFTVDLTFLHGHVWVPGLSVVWRQKCLFWLNNSDNSFNDTRRCWEKQWVAENGRNPWCCAIGGWWQIP